MTDKNDPFENMEGDFDEQKIALQMAAEFLVPMFKTFVEKGLSPQEAAALTAAIMSQGMPIPPVGPQEGS